MFIYAQVRHLCSLGGIGAKDVIHRIMSAMFTNALAAQYNWYGKGQKIGLAMMELAKVIKGKYSHFTHLQGKKLA